MGLGSDASILGRYVLAGVIHQHRRRDDADDPVCGRKWDQPRSHRPGFSVGVRKNQYGGGGGGGSGIIHLSELSLRPGIS